MTVKEILYNTLASTKVPVAYGSTDITKYPRMLFHLIDNKSERTSNGKHHSFLFYQVTYFSRVPLEVEDDEKLTLVEQKLKDAGFLVGDWMEITSEQSDFELTGYQYILQVRKMGGIN